MDRRLILDLIIIRVNFTVVQWCNPFWNVYSQPNIKRSVGFVLCVRAPLKATSVPLTSNYWKMEDKHDKIRINISKQFLPCSAVGSSLSSGKHSRKSDIFCGRNNLICLNPSQRGTNKLQFLRGTQNICECAANSAPLFKMQLFSHKQHIRPRKTTCWN